MYDFANSGYTTVVLTALYNAYFVGVIAGSLGTGRATFLWTLALGLSNGLVILSAPLIGAIADSHGAKKRFLAISTGLCVLATALLGLTQSLPWAMALIVLSNLAFATGENLISAFLPEIAPEGRMGRVSAFGWSLGYVGGITVLALSLATMQAAGWMGLSTPRAVSLAMIVVAVCYGLAALPTFLWVPEQPVRPDSSRRSDLWQAGFGRLRATWQEIGSFRDLRWFLGATLAYACGSFTVIVLAAVYAREVIGFGAQETMGLILVLNLAAAGGAFGFGQLQDRWGSVPALALSLAAWIASLGLAYLAQSRPAFWVAALGVGLALGGSQSVGRALLGLLTPPGRLAEFYGFWGMTLRLAALVGPVSFGAIAEVTGGNLRLGLLSTAAYFLLGLLLLTRVDERRGRAHATQKRPKQTS
jgi:UMF1 family MFS transporter